MDFSGLVFLLKFLPLFLLFYYVAPGRAKNIVLLLGSLCFYAWSGPVCVGLAALSAIVNFLFGRLMEDYKGRKEGRILLAVSVGLNFGALFLFGYADLLTGMINALLKTHLPALGLSMPVGCTVYTLQAVSYLTDIYRGKEKAGKNILDFGAYLLMFPQSAAGPIVRYQEIEEGLKQKGADLHRISLGAQRACIGLAKKVILADGAGRLWQEVAGADFQRMSTATAWLGMLAFGFRIYFYLSGYSDIAIGLAACLGFSFPENFRHPFAAVSVRDFWHRWQITLGKWVRDYVYLPLGGSGKGLLRQAVNMAAAWALTGLWYGADWTFALWGLWCGAFLLLEKLFLGRILKAAPKVVGWLYTIVVMALGGTLFALDDLTQVRTYLLAMVGGNGGSLVDARFFYLGLEYLPILVLSLIASAPFAAALAKKLREGRTGAAMAFWRFGEKVIPGLLLIASLFLIVAG